MGPSSLIIRRRQAYEMSELPLGVGEESSNVSLIGENVDSTHGGVPSKAESFYSLAFVFYQTVEIVFQC